jgi:replicative DNA helicase
MSNQLGKLPPQAIDLERAVLGALMLERDCLSLVVDILHPDSFYKEGHQEIYKAIKELFISSEPIDMLTVTNRLRKNGSLEKAGGAYGVTELTRGVNSSANIEFHARIISEMAIKRGIIRISSDVATKAYTDTVDAFALLEDNSVQLSSLAQRGTSSTVKGAKELLKETIEGIIDKSKREVVGIPSGIKELDKLTGGWQDTELVILAARPGMGKTALALTCIRNAAIDYNTPTVFFSLEMSETQLFERLISAESEVDSTRIKKGNVAEYEVNSIVNKTNKLGNAPIYIDDTPSLSILELRAKARRYKDKYGIKLIFIDYLQLMSGDRSNKNGNREQEVSQISRSLKALAKELNLPVIALSQLSRAVESRGGDKRPQLSDLRESGSIEQDADMVMFLYRPEYYGITEDENGLSMIGVAEAIIAKHRGGSLENVAMKFIGKFMKFTDLEESSSLNFDDVASEVKKDKDYTQFKNIADEDVPF